MLSSTEQAIEILETAIDEFILSGYTKTFIAKKILSFPISTRTANDLLRYYMPLLDELKAIETDSDLQEAYSHLKARERVRYISTIESIIEMVHDIIDAAKVVRKPRKKKVISPEKLVSSVKLHEGKYECAGIVYETKPATEIIHAKKVFLFNTKYNVFTMLDAGDGELSVKGQTIINYDETKSLARAIKPAKILNRSSWTQSALELILNKSTKAGAFRKVAGRLGESTLIIRAYK